MRGIFKGIVGLGRRAASHAATHGTGTVSKLAPSLKFTRNLSTIAKFNLAIGVGLPLLTGETMEEKIKGAGTGLLLTGLTMGMGPGRQFLAQMALMGMPQLIRGTAVWHRQYLENRTMAAVPFSYSSAAMDHAAASLQYGMMRMQDGYSSVGREATFFAARYAQR